MSGRHAVRRIELALAAVVATAVLLMLVVTVDAVRFHLPALVDGRHAPLDAHGFGLAALVAVQCAVWWRAARSLLRQAAAQRRVRRLPVLGWVPVGAHRVAVVGGREPRAFCAGLLRPRVCVTAPALARLAPDQLRAVVEHEACHVRRRDPLRLAVAQVAADGFGFVAPVRRLTARQAAVADLAADAAAVAALGSPRPLAAALVSMLDPAPERVDQLLGRALPVPHGGLAACAVSALGVLGALAVALVLLPADPALPLAFLPVFAVPALLAFRFDAV